MKFFWKYIFPVLFGLTIYTSIRLVNDTISGTQFWKRIWITNAIEIGSTIVVSYLFTGILNYFIRKNSSRSYSKLTLRILLKEFATVAFFCLLVLNSTMIPMAALTDDGLQIYDVVTVNLIPLLYLLLFYSIARGNNYLRAYSDQQVQMEKIRNDNLQTELKFLKAQYHPHFLFNALNTIYFQMDEDVKAAKKSVEKFSELLRYQLYDQQQTVPVSQELHYLKNFIELQKVRSSEKLKLSVHFDNSLNGQQVYPLLLLPLVENAFKYVGGGYAINIEGRQQNEELLFKVENSLPLHPSFTKENGIGLENLKRRLELLYPGKHEFTTQKKTESFTAILKLNLN